MRGQPAALPKPGEIMMAVPEEAALRQVEIEALRQITDNLRRLNDGQAEMMKTVHQIDARLIRQEERNNQLIEIKAQLKEQGDEIDSLKSERDQRRGAMSLVEWLSKHWPLLILIFVVAAFTLRASGKLSL